MSRVSYLFKNVGLLTISNFSSKLLVFFLVPLYTSVLSTSEYGTFDLAVSTASLLYPLLTVNIVDGVMRFSMEKNCSKNDIAVIGIRYIFLSITAYMFLVVIAGRFGIWKNLGGLIFFYYFFYVLNQFFIQFAKGLEKVFDMAVAGVIGTISMIVFNLLLMLVFHQGLKGFFIANILAQAIPTVYFFVRLRFWQYVKTWRINKALHREMLKYSVPLLFSTLGWWVNSSLDRYAVTWLCGVAANGLLSVSYKIPTILNTIQGIFTQAWQISAIKEYGEKDIARFYGITFSSINMVMCAACAVLIFLTRPIASFLYANDFYEAWRYVPFLLVSSVLNCASGLLGPILSAQRNTKAMMWSAILGAVVNVVFNVALIYSIGVQGAAVATATSSLAIYIVRRIAVGQDIVIENKYWITWLLLTLQACIEITYGNQGLELLLILVIVIANWNLIKTEIAFLRQISRR